MSASRSLLAALSVGVLLTAALAACGSRTSSSLGTASIPAAQATQSGHHVTLVLTLPARSSASVRRLPAYISSATLGATVTVNVGTPLTTAFSLAPGSGTCTTSGGANVCTLAAPSSGFGSGSVTVKLYDQQPSMGLIPSSAALLSSGTVAVQISEGAANVTLPVVLAGVLEGVSAGNPGTLGTVGTASQTSFVLQGVDGDGNVILASSGATTRTGGAVSLTLNVPASISGVTLHDVTTNGPTSTSISSVSIGDTIQVSKSASTPDIIGVPIVAVLATNPVGIVRVPATASNTAPIAIATSYPLSGTEIAAVPPYASFDGVTSGGGFAFLSNSPSLTGFAVNYALHVAITKFQCTVPGAFTIDHIAVGTYPNLVEAQHTTTDTVLATVGVGSGTCSSGTQAFSAQSQYGIGWPNATLTDVAEDSVNLGGAFKIVAGGGNGQNAILTAPYNGTVSGGGNAIGTGSDQAAVDSLNMWYDKASVLATGFQSVVYRNPTNVVQSLSLTNSSPVASVSDNAGHLYVFFNDGPGTVLLCTLGAPGSCSYAGALAAYNPSYDHRAMALGADGILYVATNAGYVHFDPANNTSYSAGSAAYKQAVASGDGHIYFLRSSGSGVDAIP